MSTTLRTHPWWVAGLAALLAAAATVGVLALAGAFLFAGPGLSGLVGDTKADVGTSAQGQKLAYQAGAAAGAGR